MEVGLKASTRNALISHSPFLNFAYEKLKRVHHFQTMYDAVSFAPMLFSTGMASVDNDAIGSRRSEKPQNGTMSILSIQVGPDAQRSWDIVAEQEKVALRAM